MKQKNTPNSDLPISAPEAHNEIDGAQLINAIWRAKFKILIPTLLVTSVAFLYVATATPEYRSGARILIERNSNVYMKPNAANVQGINSDDGQVETDNVITQVQYLMSRDLARDVISSLHLTESPEFDKSLGKSEFSTNSFLNFSSGPVSSEEIALKRFFKKLDVYNTDKSRVISIDFTSRNPETAAAVANTLAKKYIERRREQVRETTREAAEWLSKEIEVSQQRVDAAERKVENYRAQNGLYSLNGATSTQSLTGQQLAEVSTQYMAAQSQKADSEAKSKHVWSLIQSKQPLESSDILNTGLIAKMNEQITFVKNELANQSTILLSGHPRIQQLRSILADLQVQARQEAERVARGYENDAKIATARAEALSQSLNAMKKNTTIAGDQEVKLRELERDAKSQRDILESMMTRYRDAVAQQNIESLPVPARIISVAMPSSEIESPKAKSMIFAAFFISFLAGILVVAVKTLFNFSTPVPAQRTAAPSRPVRRPGRIIATE